MKYGFESELGADCARYRIATPTCDYGPDFVGSG